MAESNSDPELKAMQDIVEALEPLDPDARKRVTEYIGRRLNLSFASTSTTQTPNLSPQISPEPSIPFVGPVDIRSLKEQKKPTSASEMSAIVAFYLAEFAPIEERKTTIETADIVKYFKQAGYPLPKAIAQTLLNAVRSGFFDTTGGGRYRLNPVGYNLVVHGLPAKVKKGK